MARRTVHKCAFRRLAADQGTFTGDSVYRYGETWCGDRSLFSESERSASPADSTCPKCAAALGAAKLAELNRDGAAIELARIEPEAAKASADYHLKYARSAYALRIAGELRGYIIAQAGFGKGWSLRMVAGALSFAHSDGRECGDSVSGDKPDGWRKPGGWRCRMAGRSYFRLIAHYGRAAGVRSA